MPLCLVYGSALHFVLVCFGYFDCSLFVLLYSCSGFFLFLFFILFFVLFLYLLFVFDIRAFFYSSVEYSLAPYCFCLIIVFLCSCNVLRSSYDFYASYSL